MSRPLVSLASLALLASGAALAHHGWNSFDQNAPIYVAGTVAEVRWQNPHAELVVEMPAATALPADLASRTVPAQEAVVDGPAILAKAALPRAMGRWTAELAPLPRMQAWQVAEIPPGAKVELVGYTFAGQAGEQVMRVEFLFVDGKAYSIRSMPRP